MTNNPINKFFWGIGLENETYFQMTEWLIVDGQFIREKMGRERYSINYLNCYKEGTLEILLEAAFDPEKYYRVSRMINSHCLEKMDVHYEHKTLLSKTPNLENPDYSGRSILETFLEQQPHAIQSLLTQKNNPNGPIIFDGDTIEFVTKYFENRTVQDTVRELLATKKVFLDKLNETGVINSKLHFTDYNVGINMFMTNQKNLVLFNNGTFHFHFTLPTLTSDSRIVDYAKFDQVHGNAIYLLQWFEPLFIATLGSPDIMGHQPEAWTKRPICLRINAQRHVTIYRCGDLSPKHGQRKNIDLSRRGFQKAVEVYKRRKYLVERSNRECALL